MKNEDEEGGGHSHSSLRNVEIGNRERVSLQIATLESRLAERSGNGARKWETKWKTKTLSHINRIIQWIVALYIPNAVVD